MRRAGGPRLEGYAVVVAVGLVAALALRRPELAVLTAPFAVVLALGLRPGRPPRVAAALVLETNRVVEGEPFGASLEVRAETAVDRLELLLALPEGVEPVEGGDALALRLRAGDERTLPVTLRCRRWGLYDVGELELRARDAVRVVTWERRDPPHDAVEGLSAGRVAPAHPRAARDAGLHGQRGRMVEGRRDRIRRPPRVRARRPPALDQLAGVRAP